MRGKGLLEGSLFVVVVLKPDESVVVFGKRIVNRGAGDARLVILREPTRIEIDRKPYPQKRGEAKRTDLIPLKQEVEKWEAAIGKLNRQMAKIDEALADGVTYAGPPARAAKLNQKRSEVMKLIEGAEARWITASETYDKARSKSVG